MLLYRDARHVVRQKPVPCRWSLYVEVEGLSSAVEAQLRKHALRVDVEGQYLRSDWKNRDSCDSVRQWLASKCDPPVLALEADVNPVRRHFADTGDELDLDLDHVCYVDIETDDRGSILETIEGKSRILSWSLACHSGEAVDSAVLSEDTDQAELVLLRALVKALTPYDTVVAWNGDRFDFPVLEKRADRVDLGVEWRRWSRLDHLALYKKYSVESSGEQKTSMALDEVARAVVGGGKVVLMKSMWETWQQDPDGLAKYNMHDADLMRQIEDKTHFVGLHLEVCKLCRCFPNTWSLHATDLADGYLLRLGVEHGHRFASKSEDGREASFEGAFVMEPKPGVYENVQGVDYASLYPSVIQSWNISPETYLPAGTHKDVAAKDTTVTPTTQAVFRADVVGLVPRALDDLVTRRKKMQAEQAALSAGTPEWETLAGQSAAFKVVINSFYGVMGSPFSRYYDREIGRAVSLTAKWLTEELIKFLEGEGITVIYADTDSGYLLCEPARAAELVKRWNEVEVPKLLEQYRCPRNTVKLAFEKTFRRIIFVTAKRYAGSLESYKGTKADPDALEIRGLEYRRGDQVRLGRRMQENFIRMLLRVGDVPSVEELESVVKEWKDRVLKQPLDLDDVVIAQSVQRLMYKAKTPPPHARVAALMTERGETVFLGSKIRYWFAKDNSPLPVSDYDPEKIDRVLYWERRVWPPTSRILAAVYPDADWGAHDRVNPRRRRKKKDDSQSSMDFGARTLVLRVSMDAREDEDGWRKLWEAVRAIVEANPGSQPVEVHICEGEYRAVVSTALKAGAKAVPALSRLLGRGSVLT